MLRIRMLGLIQGGSKMAKILSLKTGKQLGGQDFEENDRLVTEKGFHIGVLPKDEVAYFRNLQEELVNRQVKINQLNEEFEAVYVRYLNDIQHTLIRFKYISNFDPETEELFIGEDGHMWTVSKDFND